MDINEKKHSKGKTVEVGRSKFKTDVKRYTILDIRLHKNYVPSIIMRASQADVGVLVTSVKNGKFETDFDRGGQWYLMAMRLAS